MNDYNLLPCDGCDARSSCRGACARLHKFLREDKKCHTRIRATELVLPAESVAGLSDFNQADGSRLDWQDIAGATLGYLDIQEIDFLTDGEKVILSAFYMDGMTHQEIADKWRIHPWTVNDHLHKIKSKLREVYANA